MSGPRPIRDVIRELRIELRIFNDKVAATAALNPHDLDILDVIDREGPCTPSQLAERTGYRRATLTGVLARLEQERWITREHAPSDRRSVLLSSTDRFDELRKLYAPLDDAATMLTENLTAEERGKFERTLVDITASVRRLRLDVASS